MSSTLVLVETATMYLASIPSPPQGVWQLGPLSLRGCAIPILVGVLVGIYWMQRRYVIRSGDPELALDTAITVIPAGIIGGRLYHIATGWEKYFGPGVNPVDAPKITNGGLGIQEAVALGVLAAWMVTKWRKVSFASALDAVASAIIPGQVIGCLGSWPNQKFYDGSTSLSWGLEIYQRVNEFGRVAPVAGTSTGEVLIVVHSTFLYEMMWNVPACLAIIWADRRSKMGGGRVFAPYVTAYTLGRFFIELMHVDDATLMPGVHINNITSLVVFSCTVITSWILRARSRETAAEVRGEREAAEVYSASN